MRTVVVVALVVVGAVAVLAGSPASGAPDRASVDVYIRGKVIQRVPGKNVALVDISWDYKCFGDKLGDATYEWTLKVQRRQPKPVTTMTLGYRDDEAWQHAHPAQAWFVPPDGRPLSLRDRARCG